MKLDLINVRLVYQREEILAVVNAIGAAAAVAEEARLESKERGVIEKLDFVLNKLIVEVPDRLSVCNPP